MEIWVIIVIVAVALAVVGAGAFLLKKFLLDRKNQFKKVNASIVTEIGSCTAEGDTGEFRIRFKEAEVDFLVQNGVITGFRKKDAPNFEMVYSFNKKG